MPIWARAVVVTLLVQTTSSFVSASLPLLGPVLTTRWGMPPEGIGYVSAMLAFGICWFLACGNAMLEQLGPVRSLQAGLAVMGLGLAFLTQPHWAFGLLGAMCFGLGLAPNTPAGSQILIRTSPQRHRNLIFSLKQAGVPLGGALAGASIASLALIAGFPGTIAALGLLVLISVLAVQPSRQQLDADRAGNQPDWWRMFAHPSAIARSIRILSLHTRLLQMTAIGVSLQLLQACVTAFTATYLVAGHGQTLAAAGQTMAILLSASAIARVVFGWLADRTSAGLLILSLLALAAGSATVWLVNVDPASPWPFLACIVLLGSSALGWNGVHMAELARLAPVDQVGEVTSAASLLGFIGTVLGPVAFALIVTVSGSFSFAFMIVASQLMIVGTIAILQLIRAGSLRDRE